MDEPEDSRTPDDVEDRTLPPRVRKGPGRRPAKLHQLSDLERLRAYRFEAVEGTSVRKADLTAALTLLPEEKRQEGDALIRAALGTYLALGSAVRRPPPTVLAKHLRSIDQASRELHRLLLATGETPANLWPPRGDMPDAIRLEVCKRIPLAPSLTPDDLCLLRDLLVRLGAAADRAASSVTATRSRIVDEGKEKKRRPDPRLQSLLERLEPLWRVVNNPTAFVQKCLVVIDEGRDKDALRQAIKRYRDASTGANG